MENMMKENAVPTYVKPYKEMMIDSDQLEVPRNTYQRRQEPDQITKISLNFDERIANEPKVSYRDGRAMGDALGGYKKYLAQVVRIYNGASVKTALPIKY